MTRRKPTAHEQAVRGALVQTQEALAKASAFAAEHEARLEHDVAELRTRVSQLRSDNQRLSDSNDGLHAENRRLANELDELHQDVRVATRGLRERNLDNRRLVRILDRLSGSFGLGAK